MRRTIICFRVRKKKREAKMGTYHRVIHSLSLILLTGLCFSYCDTKNVLKHIVTFHVIMY